MKYCLLFCFSIGLMLSCSKEEEPTSKSELFGQWKLTEVYLDPGDGSGEYDPVESNKTIQLNDDGTWVSNGNICDLSIDIMTGTAGTFSTADNTIKSDDCVNLSFDITFRQDGDELLLSYPCFEACSVRYIRI